MLTELDADYLVVGSGAMGMAFTDVLMSETGATVVMVDRHHRPGGHWNDAYPYVRLHQPSSFYGVNSKVLGSDVKDQSGWNAGLYELASGAEVCTYFDQVMTRQFLASGRVQYFPSCEYTDDGRFTSIPSGREYRANTRKIVDSTYMNVLVPSVRPPQYEIADGVQCVPLNDLPRLPRPESGYVVVGAGKTGMDACLWLLGNQVDPDDITWVMPRDSWMLDRARIQPKDLLPDTIVAFADQAEAIAKSDSIEAAFRALQECGQLLRLDNEVWPTMYRCATVTKAELEQLRRIRNVVRQGRVERLEPDRIVLQTGSVPSDPGKLYVDCTADGLAHRPREPVFDRNRITLQSVRTCQQVFNAAFIGHVEAAYDDEDRKNELCTPVQHPNTDLDFLRTTLTNGMNQARWAQDPELSAWLASARLDIFNAESLDPSDPRLQDAQKRVEENALAGMMKLQQLLAGVDGASSHS